LWWWWWFMLLLLLLLLDVATMHAAHWYTGTT
jgi:hypothetical protein